MKTKLFLWINLAVFLAGGICMAQAPHEVGGFTLGRQIGEYKDMVNMETAMPIRYQEYIHEIEIKETEGFKSGLIWIGNCASPGRIVRIKLKYSDSSEKFFNTLLNRFKERFGEPAEWRGDPFHIVIAWKWSFVDDRNNQISMTLQHNNQDEEEKMGNAVKLTLTNLMEEERECHERKYSGSHGESGSRKQEPGRDGRVAWDPLIPK
jgi:hypothetical protein